MAYVDGFVLAVPAARKDDYVAAAARTWETLFKPMGALSVMECWGDDVPMGKLTSFPQAVDLREDEVAVFSWVVWPDKATRDNAHANPPDIEWGEMPFDGARLIFGGFVPIYAAQA